MLSKHAAINLFYFSSESHKGNLVAFFYVKSLFTITKIEA